MLPQFVVSSLNLHLSDTAYAQTTASGTGDGRSAEGDQARAAEPPAAFSILNQNLSGDLDPNRVLALVSPPQPR